eukprot:SAG31_NODE_4525_length_3165_cov_1.986301_5_plen_30_part_01
MTYPYLKTKFKSTVLAIAAARRGAARTSTY